MKTQTFLLDILSKPQTTNCFNRIFFTKYFVFYEVL